MKRVFKPRSCERCSAQFVPRSSMSKWCDLCLTRECSWCGTEFRTRPIDIERGKGNYCSQGCFSKGRREVNEIEVAGDVAYIVLTDKYRNPVAKAVIDAADAASVLKFGYRWVPVWCQQREAWTAEARVTRRGRKRNVLLHRWLLGAPKHLEVDHINHDPLDNRRSNLRLCTRQQNSENRRGAYSTSRSGIRGVSWYEPGKKWRATVTVHGRQISLGYYDRIEEAEKAAIAGRQRYMTHSEN